MAEGESKGFAGDGSRIISMIVASPFCPNTIRIAHDIPARPTPYTRLISEHSTSNNWFRAPSYSPLRLSSVLGLA